MGFFEKFILFLATGAGSGRIPFAPGTFGTIAGIPVVFLLYLVPSSMQVFSILVVILFAMWTSDRAEALIGEKDPGCIVIDEIAGLTVAMAGISLSVCSVASGFLIFRLFDIIKPFPVSFFEKKFHGGAGIVLDDVVAGLYSIIVLRILF
ncbi:MAG: phosphatidylglycerophosphatase A [Desulfobacteraceae bacterium]